MLSNRMIDIDNMARKPDSWSLSGSLMRSNVYPFSNRCKDWLSALPQVHVAREYQPTEPLPVDAPECFILFLGPQSYDGYLVIREGYNYVRYALPVHSIGAW